MVQVLAGKVLFFCLERDPGLSGSVDFFSDFFCLVTTLGLGAWSQGHTHRSERARLFFLQLLGAWITVRSEWAVFPLQFLLGFLDQLSGGPAHRYCFFIAFSGVLGQCSPNLPFFHCFFERLSLFL